MNKNLEEILNDIYNYINVDVRYIEKDFNLVFKTDKCNDFEKFIERIGLYKDIKKNKKIGLTLTYESNIHFICVPIVNSSAYSGFIIVGPFTSDRSLSTEYVPYKPLNYTKFLIKTIKEIIREYIHMKELNHYVQSSIKYVHNFYYENIKIDDLCHKININKSYFCRLFKKEVGYTFCDFLNMFRVEKSKQFLLNQETSVLDVALSVGYNNQNYYSSVFKKYNHITPLAFRNLYAKGSKAI